MTQTYGQLLRDVRHEQGVTLGQLAREIGVTVPWLSKVEVGQAEPFSEAMTQRICAFLGSGLTALDSMQRLRTAGGWREPTEDEMRHAVATSTAAWHKP